jgi:tetratricopeptide (TPR) repeat protein
MSRNADANVWSESLALLDELLDLSPGQRQQRLQALAQEDASLAERVRQLLAADDSDDDRLDARPQWADLPEAIPVDAQALIGTRLGPWRLAELIGQGGMGLVFRAERADGQFEQQCAIKLVATGVAGVGAQRRFLRERRILAGLRHDNIAALIDGGVTAQGEPWYAMELVEGVPIDQWCDTQRLSLRERVTLFCQVLDAVRYAHSHLVVHRDLKPSNILVTADGRVKLLDFGVAKLFDPIGEMIPGQTIDLTLTPAYAAPEQLLGEHAGPATDIYTLGVLLYRLLAGVGPFSPEASGTTLLRQRMIGLDEDEIEPVWQAAARASSSREGVVSTRASVRRALRGGLGAIVHTCLKREPEQRYLNVDALADDLERWLAHRPVLAYKGRWRYRFGRFLRRHRVALAVTALVVAGISAFTVYRSVQLAQTRYERDLYTRTFDFVTDVIARGTAGENGADMSVREVLSLLQTEMGRRDLPPDVRAWLMGMIADVYAGARDTHAAVQASEQGLEQGGVDPIVQARLHEGQALALELAGRHQAALDSLDQAIALVEGARPDAQQVATLSRLLTTKVRSAIRHGLMPLSEARDLAVRALSLGEGRRGGLASGVDARAQAQAALVDVYIQGGDFDAALAESKRMQDSLREGGVLGDHLLLDTLVAGHRLVLGDTADAPADYETLIGRWVDQYGPDFRTVASVTAQYAEALERSGRFVEAVAATREARRIARRTPTDSMDVIGLDRFLARRLVRAGELEAAESVASALDAELSSRTQADALATRVQTQVVRADAALARDDVASALIHLEHAQATLAEVPAAHPFHERADRGVTRLQAELCLAQGDHRCAVDLSRRVVEAMPDLRADPTEISLARLVHVRALAALGDAARVERLLARYRAEAEAFAGSCGAYVHAFAAPDTVPTLRALSARVAQPCRR